MILHFQQVLAEFVGISVIVFLDSFSILQFSLDYAKMCLCGSRQRSLEKDFTCIKGNYIE